MSHSVDEPFSFKTFLSHRYKSPAVNRYFFRIFSEAAEIHAFIGI